jgi:hypothetical protein
VREFFGNKIILTYQIVTRTEDCWKPIVAGIPRLEPARGLQQIPMTEVQPHVTLDKVSGLLEVLRRFLSFAVS